MADPILVDVFLRLHQPVQSRLLLESPDSKLLLETVEIPSFVTCLISTSSPQMYGTVRSATQTKMVTSVADCLCNSNVAATTATQMVPSSRPVSTATIKGVRC